MIRLYADGNGGLRFAGKDPEAERLAARALRAKRRSFEEQLHERNMALLGGTDRIPRRRAVLQVVRDEGERRCGALGAPTARDEGLAWGSVPE